MGKSCSSQFRRLAAVSSLVFVSLALVFVLGPEFTTDTNATTHQGTCETENGVVSCGVEAEVRVNVGSVLTLGLKKMNEADSAYRYATTEDPDGADMTGNDALDLGSATLGGAATRNGVDVKVTTNNASGYNLTMNTTTANPYLFNSNETSQTTPTKDYFRSALVSGETTTMDMTANTNVARWGYSLSDAAGAVSLMHGTADPIVLRPNASDTSATTISGDDYTGTPAASGSVTRVYFFAKAGAGTAAGDYSNSVVFSATAAP